MKKEKNLSRIIYSLIYSILNFILLISGLLITAENLIMDSYQKEDVINSDIKIITIDDKSISELGRFNEWSREYYSTLVKMLNSDNHNPAVIGFDILFTGTFDEAIDLEFAETCKEYDNIVLAMNLLFNNDITLNEGIIDSNINIQDISIAYKELYENTESGFVNTILDKSDGYIRKCIPVVNFKGEKLESFSYKIYSKYQAYHNKSINEYKENVAYRFNYSSLPEEQYTMVSFVDVIKGKIPLADFKGSIVLVGAFAEGLQDSFSVPISRGEKMYGVQVHANIIEAYFSNNFINDVNKILLTIITTIFTFLLSFFTFNQKLFKCTITHVIFLIFTFLLQTVLFKLGLYAPLICFGLIVILNYITQIIYHYVYERRIKGKALKAFKKYVDPRVVDNVIKQGNYEIKLGGEKIDIACLFVDIRGFTTISESLDPTNVVEIINEYLSLTSKSILNNKGTLDKYIGDATMAIFNAPFKTEDYIYNAVMTGIEIAEGSAQIEKKFLEKYGKKVSFGIGINCGKAVVGNIGSAFRMEYTAIGDTVNTAARLESTAKAGEILISEKVYESVKDRINAEFVGEYQFKGKQELVKTYRVIGRKR